MAVAVAAAGAVGGEGEGMGVGEGIGVGVGAVVGAAHDPGSTRLDKPLPWLLPGCTLWSTPESRPVDLVIQRQSSTEGQQ